MRIYLVRHGETDWNKQQRLQGREDVPLNESGKEQARICGEAIKELSIDLIVTSPLSRAKDTAKIIGTMIGKQEVIVDENLIERDFGEASGMTYREKNDTYSNRNIPGYEETPLVLKRMQAAMYQYATQYPDGTILMVSHGGTMNALLTSVNEQCPKFEMTRLHNTYVSVLEIEGEEVNLMDYNLEPNQLVMKYKKI